MNRTDRFIVDCPSFEEFRQRTSTLPLTKDRGDAFERLTQVYLQTAPEYRTALEKVWLLREVPASVRAEINLPRDDFGIDLIARHRSGKYWAIQAKFRSDEEGPLGWGDLSTFTALSAAPRQNIALTVVAHPIARPVGRRELMHNFVEIGLDAFRQADWSLIQRTILENAPASPIPSTPTGRFDWQRTVIDEAVKHFRANARGRAQLPCGTGKSLIAYFIANAMETRRIIVAVPSLNLIKQTVGVWLHEEVARGRLRTDWLCVASDDSVGEVDDIADERADIGLPTTTDANKIADWLRQPTDRKIVFTTYHSSPKLAEAARLVGAEFDLTVLDEAHRTAGARDREFVTLLHDDKVKTRRRLFMTATERKIRGNSDSDSDVLFSMDDNIEDYGARFYTMSFKEAIKRSIITDYRIVTYFVKESEVEKLIKENRLLNLDEGHDLVAARDVATAVATKRVLEEYGVKHPLVFHRGINASKAFRHQQDFLNGFEIGPVSENFHVDSTMSAGERKERLDQFIQSPVAVMCNARCLTEGVDVPGIDAVVFAAPKQSTVDIVQASGRALRRAKGKEFGYIVIPIIVPDDMAFDAFAESTQFKTIIKILRALSTQDDRIIETLRARFYGPNATGGGRSRERIIQIGGEVPVGFKMDVEEFADAIETVVWKTVARDNWRPFEEARDYVRSLGLKNYGEEWRAYAKSNAKPGDIPAYPNESYANAGWQGWGDWLGNGQTKSFNWRPFEEACEFVRSLGIKSKVEWEEYRKTDKRPVDIPSNPNDVYKDTGWNGWGDWFGTGKHIGRWRPFEEAREFVRPLAIKTTVEWKAFSKSPKRPRDIPAIPYDAYPDQWRGWSDWLGNDAPPKPESWRPFDEARQFARSLGLRSVKEWNGYRKRKPNDIPSNPNNAYKDAGWIDWSDWLGTGNKRRGGAKRSREFKLEALRRMEAGENVSALARELGVSYAVIYKWRDRYRMDGSNAFRGGGRMSKTERSAHEEKLAAEKQAAREPNGTRQRTRDTSNAPPQGRMGDD